MSELTPSTERHAAAAERAALGGLNALVEAANPILAVVPQIRHALRHPDPAGLRTRLLEHLRAFERRALAAGIPPHHAHTARFALCALLDDSATATPWGREWPSLLGELHGEGHGAERFFALLDDLLRRPRRHVELLEFFFVCLALGFEGRYRDGEGGRRALAQIRARLYEVIVKRQAKKPHELSARWRGAAIGPPRVRGAFTLRGATGELSTKFNRLLAALVGGAARDQKSDLLRERFEDALGVLRTARFRTPEGKQRTLAELPWYLVIGAPGSGKTTALLNAGLRFPLGDPRTSEAALHGIAGTRHCDWWFTEQAVLIDTAGRYTTQEREYQADAEAWLGFLDLLRRVRPSQPLNGVIITLSVADLVQWDEQELARYAGHVRSRVREIYARLAVRLPIYLMVTKSDLLAGFNEYFAEFDGLERAQVWGTTFEPSGEARSIAERFKEDIEGLERRLYALLPERLQATRDLQKRATIYRFPQQLRVTGPLVGRFVDAAFGGEWPGGPPFVRGVYFSSGTQEASPIDRVLGTLARSFNLERKVELPVAGAGKSYFLKRLLNEVIFGESGLAGLDRSLECGGEAA